MREFLEMGGYAEYVWPAYLVSAAVLVALAVATWMRSRKMSAKLKELGGEDLRDREV